MNKSFQAGFAAFSLVGVGYLLFAGLAQIAARYMTASLQQSPLDLRVAPISQARATSCGEAVITMAYNHAHPDAPVSEQAVIEYAAANGYFTETLEPFTSPADMVAIARNYSRDYSSGMVLDSNQALLLLIRKLRAGDPVIIDIRTRLDDPQSGAHFVLVTGISVDPDHRNAITIRHNDPLTGTGESAAWSGADGLWHAWQHNGDPGGSGWWLVMPGP